MTTKPAIVVAAFNRPLSLRRILSSLGNAALAGHTDVPLIISIDGGGSKDVPRIAEDFVWKHGAKQVIRHEQNLGLRRHILSCGDLSQEFASVIVLEEDCYVSRHFYGFAVECLNYYQDEPRIAGVSLHSPRHNETAYLPFLPLHDGYDVFFMQVPSSSGQMWTRQQWRAFRKYYDQGPTVSPLDPLPPNVIAWPETSWKKYFYKYMVENDLFFAYPAAARATNFCDRGTHQVGGRALHQVPIETNRAHSASRLVPLAESQNKYDAFYEILPECLISYGVDIDPDTCVDLHGARQLDRCREQYALSIKECSAPLRSFGCSLFPLALNLIYPTPGDSLGYARTGQFGPLGQSTRWNLIQKMQPVGCHFGVMVAQSSRYYRAGYALAHPKALLGFVRLELRSFLRRCRRFGRRGPQAVRKNHTGANPKLC